MVKRRSILALFTMVKNRRILPVNTIWNRHLSFTYFSFSDAEKQRGTRGQSPMTNSASRPALVSISKAPKVYGLSRSTVYRLAERGEIDVVKVGRSSYVVDASFKIDQLPRLLTKTAA